MTDKQERFECMDCDYIGDKKSLQEHVISSGMTHKMKPTPTTPSQWEEELNTFGRLDVDLFEKVENLIRQTLQQERQRWIAELEGKQEVHTHNSIPGLTSDFEGGCITCHKNQGLQTAIDTINKNKED